MTERLKAFWIGLFLVASIGLLTWFLLFLHPGVGDGKKMLHVRFSNVERINRGSRVYFAGKAVGEVESIHIINEPRSARTDSFGNLYLFELLLRVDSSVSIYSSDEITFTTSGLLGEKAIVIYPKSPLHQTLAPREITGEVLYAQSQDKVVEVMSKLSTVADQFSTLVVKASDFFDDMNERDLPSTVASTFEQLNCITSQIATGRGTMGQLLSENHLHTQLTSTITHLDTLLQDVNNYGFLFQWNSTWQKDHARRMRQLSSLRQEREPKSSSR